MSLTSSMWTSVSGLINHGEKMNVIGNNIANVNTVGFKGQRMDFMDFVYQDVGSASGISQVGRGVAIGAILGDFGQGAFETSTEVTDLALAGKGFFGVVPKGSEQTFYTRAGNFRFDKDGFLTEPHGYVLQGWPITSSDNIFGTAAIASEMINPFRGSGVSGDIQLENFSVPPRHTNNVTFQVQLHRNSDVVGLSNSTTTSINADMVFDNAGVLTEFVTGGTTYSTTSSPPTLLPPTISGGQITAVQILVAGQPTTITLDNPVTPPAAGSGVVTISATGASSKAVASVNSNVVSSFEFDAAGDYTSVVIKGQSYPIGTWTEGGPPTFTPTFTATPQAGGPAVTSFTVNLDGQAAVVSFAAGSAPLQGLTPDGGTVTGVNAILDSPSLNNTPFFGLFENWDGRMTGTNQTPLSSGQFNYSTNLKVYDEGGTAHTLTVYFAQVPNDELNNAVAGNTYWQYIVTMDPAQDNRTFESPSGSGIFIPVAGTKEAGILMTGTMTFDSGGQMLDTSAFAPGSTMTADGMTDLANWKPAQLSPNGLPLFAANFSGRDNMSYVDINNPASLPFMTELSLGLFNTSRSWNLPAGVASAADIGNNAASLPSIHSLNNPARRAPIASTSNGAASSTILQRQDGYSFGFLSSVSVSADGVLSGRYSNGIVKELFQLTIFDFVSQQNLRREGGNLFAQTLESGDPAPGIANNNGLGSVNSYSLEQSNVDLSREFTQMITTQRGFQANSKGITTVDTMLDTVINMKR